MIGPNLSTEEVESHLDSYVPNPHRKGVALCLSGGGYRAALFHLGALRRLNELGILGHIDTVSAVSGGSILTAHVVDRLDPWPAPAEVVADWDERVARPFHEFTSHDIRTWPILKRLMPWNWFRDDTAVETLVKRYEHSLSKAALSDLPEKPRIVFSATDLSYGVDWVSMRDRIGDYEVGYVHDSTWTVGRAVAASSCFPPIFNPMKPRIEPSEFRGGKGRRDSNWEADVRGLRLSDGGVYDNMGLEPVWKDHAIVLVSDGGAPFDFGPDAGVIWRLQRYTSIVSRQASGIRKRWLIAGFKAGQLAGTYWGIRSSVLSYDETLGYGDELVEHAISEVRTDMDVFSEAERCVLENHGYCLTDAAVRKHAPQLIAHDVEPAVPHPEWMDEAKVESALRDSKKIRLVRLKR